METTTTTTTEATSLPGGTVEWFGVSIWDPSRIILWLIVIAVVIAAVVWCARMERSEQAAPGSADRARRGLP